MVDDASGTPHPYVGASAGCWEVYGQVLSREYEALPLLRETHLLTVDTYSVQHPGVPERRSVQSVNVHLMRLYLALELGSGEAEIHAATRRLLKGASRLVWLTPPRPNGTLTVLDVLAARDLGAHREAVAAWARDVWRAWSLHHAYAARLGESCLSERTGGPRS